jgi:glycosyltransferase involved in cell wall biosynthesis
MKVAAPQTLHISASQSLDVSVIVPTLNRSRLLQRALISLSLQTFSADRFEIIVVDNGCTDDTKQVVDAFIESSKDHKVRYIYEPEPGLLAGRHRGAAEASGKIFVFVDDDIEATHDWLSAIVTAFDDVSVQLVGGRNLPKYEIPPPAWIESFWDSTPDGGRYCWYLSLLDLGQTRLIIDPTSIFGLNFSIRRHAFYNLGGFHPDCLPNDHLRFHGDGESGLTVSAEALGEVAVYEPRATVYHFVPANRMTVEYFEKRAFIAGVEKSYSDVRRNRGLQITPWPKMRCIAGKALRFVKRQTRMIICPQDTMILTMRNRLERSYQAGFVFHQRAVDEDRKVLNWVLRSNYWDYRLPR